MKTSHLFTYDFRPEHVYHIPNAPHNVMLDVSYQCNLRCRFCYNHQDQFSRPFSKIDQIKRILDILISWGVKEILYLGGEPLLFPYFADVIHHGSKFDLVQRVVTNGTLVNERIAKLFRRCHVEVGVSLHGIEPASHDLLTRRPGSFLRAVQAMECLEENGVTWFLQYTPTRGDARLLPVAQWLLSFFDKNFVFMDINRLLPMGTGAIEQDKLFPTEEEWWQIIRDIALVTEMNISVRVESVPHCWVHSRAKTDGLSEQNIRRILAAIRPCYMAINQIAIDPQGRFKICPGASAFSPSILEIPPQDIWNDHPVLTTRRKLQFLPACCINYSQEVACPNFYACGGGCKMANKKTKPTIGSLDPLITDNGQAIPPYHAS